MTTPNTSPTPNHKWHPIHSYHDGWGLQEHIPNNTIIIEDHTNPKNDHHIPYTVIKHKQPQRTIWANDAHRLLGIDIFHTQQTPQEIYTLLQPLLEKERQEISQLPTPVFNKITVPAFKQPLPDIRSILAPQQEPPQQEPEQ